jgi:DNA-binding NtrC family response regulator
MELLVAQSFPGNVRELKNTVERAAQMADGPMIVPSDLVFDRLLEHGRANAADVEPVAAFKDEKQTAIDDFEAAYLRRLAARTGGSLRRAALLAGVQRHYLRALFKKHGIPVGQNAD